MTTSVMKTKAGASPSMNSSIDANGSTIATHTGSDHPCCRHSLHACASAGVANGRRRLRRASVAHASVTAAPRHSGTSPRRARDTARRAAKYASGSCGARMPAIRDSAGSSSIAITETMSITVSHPTAATTRRPRMGYAVQVSACIHAMTTAPNSTAQSGTSKPPGHAARRAASPSTVMLTVPYNIGQPASPAVVTGSVNRRAGYIDWRAARSPAKPKLKSARR